MEPQLKKRDLKTNTAYTTKQNKTQKVRNVHKIIDILDECEVHYQQS